jgi:RimJ/RimL family protein N-acetyltransferase
LQEYDSYEKHGFSRWSVRTKENNTWTGWCGLRKNTFGHVDLGFRFQRRFWNKGYATEASNACLKYAFENPELNRIIARSNVNNLASITVFKKLSLLHWKTEMDSEIGETIYFQISRKMYMANRI